MTMDDQEKIDTFLDLLTINNSIHFKIRYGRFFIGGDTDEKTQKIAFQSTLPVEIGKMENQKFFMKCGPFHIIENRERDKNIVFAGDLLLREFITARMFGQVLPQELEFIKENVSPQDFDLLLKVSEPKACPKPNMDSFSGEAEKF